MKRCPHCANMVDDEVESCPFCNANLSGPGRPQERFERHGDAVEEKGRRESSFLSAVGYLLIIVLVGAGSFLAGMFFWRPQTDYRERTQLRQEKAQEGAEENEQQIRGLESQLSRLRKELDESSQKIAQLEARLKEPARSVPPAERKVQSGAGQAEKSTTPPAVKESALPKPAELPPPSAWRRPAEPGSYELIRTTLLFAQPSESSRMVRSISKGTRVTVVASAGEWLEVRSKRSNPPGFIRRSDAMFVEKTEQELR